MESEWSLLLQSLASHFLWVISKSFRIDLRNVSNLDEIILLTTFILSLSFYLMRTCLICLFLLLLRIFRWSSIIISLWVVKILYILAVQGQTQWLVGQREIEAITRELLKPLMLFYMYVVYHLVKPRHIKSSDSIVALYLTFMWGDKHRDYEDLISTPSLVKQHTHTKENWDKSLVER